MKAAKKQLTVLVFTPYLGGFFLGQINAFLRFWANQLGYNLIIVKTNSFGEFDRPYSLNKADAVICILNAVSEKLIAEICAKNIPVVVFAADSYNQLPVDVVMSDNYDGTTQLLEHLYSEGHRHIAYVGDLSIPDMKIRLTAYQDFIARKQLKAYIIEVAEPSLKGGKEAALKISNLKAPITNIMCTADLIALGFAQAAQHYGIDYPNSVTVTGYEATNLALNHTPSLTSVDQQLFECAESVFKKITERCNGSPVSTKPLFIKQHLHIGQSTMPSIDRDRSKQQFLKDKPDSVKAFYVNESLSSSCSNESMFSFARMGFNSLMGVSFLYGPFFTSGYKARHNISKSTESLLEISGQFTHLGEQISDEFPLSSPEIFPPFGPNEHSLECYNLFVLPITTSGEGTYKLIALYDDNTQEIDFSKLTNFQNFMDTISFIIERDAYAEVAQNNYLELVNTQEQLIESEKMSTLGNLVASVSHEVNTPLGICMTAISHLKSQTEALESKFISGTMTKKDLESLIDHSKDSMSLAMSNIERAGELIKNFKTVSVEQSSEQSNDVPSHFELCGMLKSTIESIKPTLKNTQFEIDVHCPQLITMYSFPGALSQVIINLIMNSITHGFYGAKTGNMSISVTEATSHEVSLIYQDTGKGISKEYAEKIFEPFFTTNKEDGNSGLGMHIIQNLITEKLQGSIDLISKCGEGAKFEIRFVKKITD